MIPLPGLGGVSGGAGGIDLSGGPANSSAEGSGNAGGQVFNFATPQSVQLAQTISWPIVIGAGVALWVFMRKR